VKNLMFAYKSITMNREHISIYLAGK